MLKFSVYLLALLACSNVFAQTDSLYEVSPNAYYDKYHIGIMGVVGIPSQELKEAVRNNFGDVGIGFATSLLFNPVAKRKPSTVLLGVDFSYLTYGVDKIDETSYSPPLKTTFNVYSISAAFRLLPKQSPGFAPFIDGMIGSRIFNTRTKVNKDVVHTLLNEDQPEVVNTTNDSGLCYTLGVGFFNRKIKNDDQELKGAFSLRVLYSWGDDTKYIIRDSIQLDSNNFITYETGYTSTNMLLVQIGFILY